MGRDSSTPNSGGRAANRAAERAANRERAEQQDKAKKRQVMRRALLKYFVILVPLGLLLTWIYFGPKTPRPNHFPVHGTVVYPDKSPATDLAGGIVSLESNDRKRSAHGLIRPDGTFRLSSYEEDDGAQPGEYRVLIRPAPAEKVGDTKPPTIDPRYLRYETSGLTVTIKPEKKIEIGFIVERAPTPKR